MIDIRSDIKVGLSFSLRRGRLLIHHATIRAIGNPDYMRFLLNSKEKHIAVQCCEAIDRDNFRVPELIEGDKYTFEISSSPFVSVIYKACGWDKETTYVVYGIVHEKYRLVDFDLTTAQVINPDEFVDPENAI